MDMGLIDESWCNAYGHFWVLVKIDWYLIEINGAMNLLHSGMIRPVCEPPHFLQHLVYIDIPYPWPPMAHATRSMRKPMLFSFSPVEICWLRCWFGVHCFCLDSRAHGRFPFHRLSHPHPSDTGKLIGSKMGDFDMDHPKSKGGSGVGSNIIQYSKNANMNGYGAQAVVFPIQDDMFCSPKFYYPMALTRYIVSFGAIPNGWFVF